MGSNRAHTHTLPRQAPYIDCKHFKSNHSTRLGFPANCNLFFFIEQNLNKTAFDGWLVDKFKGRMANQLLATICWQPWTWALQFNHFWFSNWVNNSHFNSIWPRTMNSSELSSCSSVEQLNRDRNSILHNWNECTACVKYKNYISLLDDSIVKRSDKKRCRFIFITISNSKCGDKTMDGEYVGTNSIFCSVPKTQFQCHGTTLH